MVNTALLVFLWVTEGYGHALPLNDAVVARFAQEMVQAIGPDDELERAAFITYSNGSYELVHWRFQARFRQAEWTGALPRNVVALIHTHPRTIPLPSRGDAETARRLGIPLFVVSRVSLSVVDPDGQIRRTRDLPWARTRRKPAAKLAWLACGTIT